MTADEIVNIVAALECISAQTIPGEWNGSGWGNIDDIFHALFDDFDRRKELKIDSLERLYWLLDEMLNECGDVSGDVFTANRLWPEAIVCSNAALSELKKRI